MGRAILGEEVLKLRVAGLSSTDAEAKFTVKSISFENGEPVVEWDPDLNEDGTTTNRAYRVEGKPALTNEWAPPTPTAVSSACGWDCRSDGTRLGDLGGFR